MIKSYKIRLIPTPEQEAKMWQHVGASRFIYNYMLAEQQRLHELGEKHLSAFSMINLLPSLKRSEEFSWLYGVSSVTLQRVCSDLDQAYKNFFSKRAGFPKFKSRKRSQPNFPLSDGLGKVWFGEKFVQIPTIGKVTYKTNYNLPLGNKAKFSNPRISYVGKKWLLTLGIECENQAPILTDKPMGIDLGVKETAVVAFGNEQLVIHNINKSRKLRQLNCKLKHQQRNLARKRKGSNNREKALKSVAETYRHITNIRHDYNHKTTTFLIKQLPCRVTVEDLNISGMMKNHHLARAIQEQCFNEILRQLTYKAEWNKIEIVKADRFYPSSKTCSHCGNIKRDLKLKDRTFKCDCGFEIDRDYNAAINLMRYESH